MTPFRRHIASNLRRVIGSRVMFEILCQVFFFAVMFLAFRVVFSS